MATSVDPNARTVAIGLCLGVGNALQGRVRLCLAKPMPPRNHVHHNDYALGLCLPGIPICKTLEDIGKGGSDAYNPAFSRPRGFLGWPRSQSFARFIGMTQKRRRKIEFSCLSYSENDRCRRRFKLTLLLFADLLGPFEMKGGPGSHSLACMDPANKEGWYGYLSTRPDDHPVEIILWAEHPKG